LLERGLGKAENPQVAMDNNGNTMVVWQQNGVYGRIYDADA
jgi:hypothetical protein